MNDKGSGQSLFEYLDEILPTHDSLDTVDRIIEGLDAKISRMHADVLTKILQSESNHDDVLKTLKVCEDDALSLVDKINNIQAKTESIDRSVSSIAEHVRFLDRAKNNLSVTVTTVDRLYQIEKSLSVFSNGYSVSFSPGESDFPGLTENVYNIRKNLCVLESEGNLTGNLRLNSLRAEYESVARRATDFLSDKFSEFLFQVYGIEGSRKKKKKSEKEAVQAEFLHGVCLLFDSLDSRQIPIDRYINRLLSDYEIQNDVSSLAPKKLSKFFKDTRNLRPIALWIKTALIDYGTRFKSVFPEYWRTDLLLAVKYCEKTSEMLKRSMEQIGDTISVDELLLLISVFRELEEFLDGVFERYRERDREVRMLREMLSNPSKYQVTSDSDDFSDGSDDSGFDVEKIKEKYRRIQERRRNREIFEQNKQKLLEYQKAQEAMKLDPELRNQNTFPMVPKFSGMILKVFENFMGVYVKHQEQKFKNALKEIQKGDALLDTTDQKFPVVRSAVDAFVLVKRSLKDTADLSRKETLRDVFQIHKDFLSGYSEWLSSALPKPKGTLPIKIGASLKSEENVDGRVYLDDDDDYRGICYVLNTVDYILKMLEQLQEQISGEIDVSLRASISTEDVQDKFISVANRASGTIISAIETENEGAFTTFLKTKWEEERDLGDVSEYARDISSNVSSRVSLSSQSLESDMYFTKIVHSLLVRTTARLYEGSLKLRKISSSSANQLILDFTNLESDFDELPLVRTLDGTSESYRVPRFYKNAVSSSFSKLRIVMKVASVPKELKLSVYKSSATWDQSREDLERILLLSDLRKSERQAILNEF